MLAHSSNWSIKKLYECVTHPLMTYRGELCLLCVCHVHTQTLYSSYHLDFWEIPLFCCTLISPNKFRPYQAMRGPEPSGTCLLVTSCHPSCPPVRVMVIKHKVSDVTLLRAVEEAGVVVRVAGLGAVVAVVAASLVSLAGIVTVSEARNRHQIVDCLT